MKKLLLGLAAALALAACDGPQIPMATPSNDAAGKQFRPPAQGKAALYIVGGKIAVLSAITVAGRQVGTLKDNTWLRIDLPPGTYDLRFSGYDNVASLDVELPPGSTTYVKLGWGGGIPIYHRFEIIDAQAGRSAVLAGTRVREITGASD